MEEERVCTLLITGDTGIDSVLTSSTVAFTRDAFIQSTVSEVPSWAGNQTLSLVQV